MMKEKQVELTREVFNLVVDVADEVGMTTQTYSGRAMYGKQCLGVVGSLSEFVRFTLALVEAASLDDAEPLAEVIEAMREGRTSSDSMGLDTIFYWPSMQVTV